MSFPALRRSFSPKFILSFLRFIFNTLNLQSRAENFSTFNEKSRHSHIAAVRFTIGEGYLSDYFICPASRGKSGKTLCKVFPVPFSVCEAPKAPRRGDPRLTNLKTCVCVLINFTYESVKYLYFLGSGAVGIFDCLMNNNFFNERISTRNRASLIAYFRIFCCLRCRSTSRCNAL